MSYDMVIATDDFASFTETARVADTAEPNLLLQAIIIRMLKVRTMLPNS
jgi:hypothetical protein